MVANMSRDAPSASEWCTILAQVAESFDIPPSQCLFLDHRGIKNGRIWIQRGKELCEFKLPQEARRALKTLRQMHEEMLEPLPPWWAYAARDPVPRIKRALASAHIPPWQYAWYGERELWLHQANQVRRYQVSRRTIFRVLNAIAEVGREEPYAR